jgi:hypothetical protein
MSFNPSEGCHLYFARRVTFLSCADMSELLATTITYQMLIEDLQEPLM